MLKAVIMVAWLGALLGTAAGQSADLSGQQIQALIAGATVEIETPIGTKLPVRYATDGQLSGQAQQLALYLGAASDTGRWWVASDRLCHKWNRWFNSEPQCLQLRKEGRRIRWWSEDGSSGTAVLTATRTQTDTEPAMAAGGAEMQAKTLLAPVEPLQAPAPISAEAGKPATPAERQAIVAHLASVPSAPIANKQVNWVAPAPAAVKPPTEPAYMVANVERDDVLNVRSGPSTEFDVIGELPPGSRGVAITGVCRFGWCPVQHQSMRGWVNRLYLAVEGTLFAASLSQDNSTRNDGLAADAPSGILRDPADAPRTCLTPPARALLERIEEKFGPVRLVSTCRPGATIAGTGRPSRHASGNAVDFDAGARKAQIVEWLIANHRAGGTMTYADMTHIHVDIGPHFVSIAGGMHWASWRHAESSFPVRLGADSRQ